MISNERPSPYGRQPHGPHKFSGVNSKPRTIETTLQQDEVVIERKIFSAVLKENPRGRFLRIIEEGGSKFSSIIIPAGGMKDFQKVLADMAQASEKIPVKKDPPPLA